MTNKLLDSLRVLGNDQQHINMALVQSVQNIGCALRTHLPAAGSMCQTDFPPIFNAPHFGTLEAMRTIILDTLDNQALYRQPITTFEPVYKTTPDQNKYFFYLLNFLTEIIKAKGIKEGELPSLAEDDLLVKFTKDKFILGFSSLVKLYGEQGEVTTQWTCRLSTSHSDNSDDSWISIQHRRYLGDESSRVVSNGNCYSRNLSGVYVAHREIDWILDSLYQKLVIYLHALDYPNGETPLLRYNEFLQRPDVSYIQKLIHKYLTDLYADQIFKTVGNYRYYDLDGRRLRFVLEAKRKQVGNYSYYLGNDGITEVIPLKVHVDTVHPHVTNDSWDERQKLQGIFNKGIPVASGQLYGVDWDNEHKGYYSSNSQLPYAAMFILPVQKTYTDFGGNQFQTILNLIFGVGTLGDSIVVSGIQVKSNFDNTGVNGDYAFFEEEILAQLDVIFKGNQNA